jgi:hypothetical protein
MVDLPGGYWRRALYHAAFEYQLEALRAILAAVGDSFVVSYSLRFLASFLECSSTSHFKGEIE